MIQQLIVSISDNDVWFSLDDYPKELRLQQKKEMYYALVMSFQLTEYSKVMVLQDKCNPTI